MRIFLLQPPIFSPTGVYLSVPSLTASLKAAGHEVHQFDLNLEFWCRLISRKNLENGSKILCDKIKEFKKKAVMTVEELNFFKEYLSIATINVDIIS
jgi:hypothetical protein